MSDWQSPPFTSLKASSQPEFRWVGSRLMDEEQYRVECWEMRPNGEAVYWRGRVSGFEEYAELRRRRREDRKASWQTRMDAEDEYTDYVNGLVAS